MSPLTVPQKNLVYFTVPRLVQSVLTYGEGKAIVALSSSGARLSWAEKDDLLKGIRDLERYSYERGVFNREPIAELVDAAKKRVLSVSVRHGFAPEAE